MLDINRFAIGPITCEQVVVGPLSNNVFLLDDGAGNRLLIDAADQPDELLVWLDGREVQQLVTTHRHHDHIGALTRVVEATGAKPFAGTPDVAAIERATGVVSSSVWTGDVLQLGAHRVEVIGLVGHTPGAICLVADGGEGPVHLFTGDSLFPGGAGKTDSPAAFASLLDDVARELFDRFDDDTVVHPGHGDSTALGAERPHLDEWRARGW